MKKEYQIWVTVDDTKGYGVWVEVDFKAFNNLIKTLIIDNEITTEKIGLHEFIKANDCVVASVTERRF